MSPQIFEMLVEMQLNACRETLVGKAREYASDSDLLHNFKVAAELQGCLPRQALAGMMAKHTVSVYDMASSSLAYPEEVWNEKINDHINYLILLRACLLEEETPIEE